MHVTACAVGVTVHAVGLCTYFGLRPRETRQIEAAKWCGPLVFFTWQTHVVGVCWFVGGLVHNHLRHDQRGGLGDALVLTLPLTFAMGSALTILFYTLLFDWRTCCRSKMTSTMMTRTAAADHLEHAFALPAALLNAFTVQLVDAPSVSVVAVSVICFGAWYAALLTTNYVLTAGAWPYPILHDAHGKLGAVGVAGLMVAACAVLLACGLCGKLIVASRIDEDES